MTLLGALAGLQLKRSPGFFSVRFVSGGFLYASSAVFNILLLRELPYSVVLPITSITYVWTVILARMVLGELFSRQKAVAITLILMGTAMIAQGG